MIIEKFFKKNTFKFSDKYESTYTIFTIQRLLTAALGLSYKFLLWKIRRAAVWTRPESKNLQAARERQRVWTTSSANSRETNVV